MCFRIKTPIYNLLKPFDSKTWVLLLVSLLVLSLVFYNIAKTPDQSDYNKDLIFYASVAPYMALLRERKEKSLDYFHIKVYVILYVLSY